MAEPRPNATHKSREERLYDQAQLMVQRKNAFRDINRHLRSIQKDEDDCPIESRCLSKGRNQKGLDWIAEFADQMYGNVGQNAMAIQQIAASIPTTVTEASVPYEMTWADLTAVFDGTPYSPIANYDAEPTTADERVWVPITDIEIYSSAPGVRVLVEIADVAVRHRPAKKLTMPLAIEIAKSIPNHPVNDNYHAKLTKSSPALRLLELMRDDLGDAGFREVLNRDTGRGYTLFQKILVRGAMLLVHFVAPFGDLDAASSHGETAWPILKHTVAKKKRGYLSIRSNYPNETKLKQLIKAATDRVGPALEVAPSRKRKRSSDSAGGGQDEVWASRIRAFEWTYGPTVDAARCICCNAVELPKMSADGRTLHSTWHRCHIIADVAMGGMRKENLLVACNDCNKLHSTRNALAVMAATPAYVPQLPTVLRHLAARNARPGQTVVMVVQELYNPPSAPCGDAVIDAAAAVDAEITVALVDRVTALEQQMAEVNRRLAAVDEERSSWTAIPAVAHPPPAPHPPVPHPSMPYSPVPHPSMSCPAAALKTLLLRMADAGVVHSSTTNGGWRIAPQVLFRRLQTEVGYTASLQMLGQQMSQLGMPSIKSNGRRYYDLRSADHIRAIFATRDDGSGAPSPT